MFKLHGAFRVQKCGGRKTGECWGQAKLQLLPDAWRCSVHDCVGQGNIKALNSACCPAAPLHSHSVDVLEQMKRTRMQIYCTRTCHTRTAARHCSCSQ
jgi:hypothetical protein